MSDYEPVIGLEVHIQPNTKEKMFCGCKNDPFNAKAPNIYTCPVCLGLPGAMPVPNEEAIKISMFFAKAMGTKLQKDITFERKNYFYPDLPKGYQLTSAHYPLGVGGRLTFPGSAGEVIVRLREIHLEEDTAKSQHEGGKTMIDFNKSGVPLLEIVTEPDLHDVDDAVKFCKEIQLIARATKTSEASMEKGQMRLEANISVRKKGGERLPDYRVELKNINSFTFMKKALNYELRRQIDLLEKDEKLEQETRGFNEKTGKTILQRTKEEAHDYRYFPEPDIPQIKYSITTSLSELPSDIRQNLTKDGLSREFIEILIRNEKVLGKYKKLVLLKYSPAKAAGLVINISEYKNLSAKEIHEKESRKKSERLEKEKDLMPFIKKVLEENQKAVSDYKKGQENSLQFLIGQVMKATQGKADAEKSAALIKEKILP